MSFLTWERALLGLALVAAVLGGTREITNEAAVSLQGDMPRYLMNGVFILDFLAAPTFEPDAALRFASEYFARYPALSLGHHPPLLPVALVPFFAAFGVSVFSARLLMVVCFVACTWLLYSLAAKQYNTRVGAWTSLLFATHPFIVTFSQGVLSEIPALLFILASFNALLLFRKSGRLLHYLCFVALVILSLAAKQLAAFLLPSYIVMLFVDGGWRRLLSGRVLVWTACGAAVTLGLLVATLVLSPFNVSVVIDVLQRGLGVAAWRSIGNEIAQVHLAPFLAAPAVAGLALALYSRDPRSWLPASWAISVVLGAVFITGPYDVARYTIYAIPAYCLLGASLVSSHKSVLQRIAVIGIALCIAGQAMRALAVRPVGAGGYEAAALAVLDRPDAPTVLYSASIDTGYFIFFVRKHDAAQRLVVLRSDKLLSTSFMTDLAHEQLISDPSEIYPLLHRYGTKFIVIEDRISGAQAIDWLREEVRGDRFIERLRIPIETTDRRLRGVHLVVYEFKDARPAAPDATIRLNLPIAGREIGVSLGALRRVD